MTTVCMRSCSPCVKSDCSAMHVVRPERIGTVGLGGCAVRLHARCMCLRMRGACVHLSCKGVALSASQSHAFRAVYSITCTCVCTVHCRLGAVCRRACLQCTRLQLRGAKLCQVRHRLHLCSHAAGTAALRQQRLHHARAQYGKSRVGRHITNAFFATPPRRPSAAAESQHECSRHHNAAAARRTSATHLVLR